MSVINPDFTVWLGYVANPVTTAVYLERALRKICRVITVGPTMPADLFRQMGIRYELKCLDIETSFTPNMKELVSAVPENFRPDLYLWVDSVGRFTHLPQNLDALKCPKVCYLIDSHFAPDYYRQYSKLFDYVFVAQLQVLDFFRQANRQSYWLPLACDPEIHRDHGMERVFPVGFVGGMNENRQRLLAKISKVTPVHYESCFLEDMARVFSASRIGFNHASLHDLNMRFFELPSTGAMQLFSQTQGSGQELLFRDGEDIVIYSEDSLEEKVRYYLKHDSLRNRIAKRGKQMVLNAHTYDHRVRELLAVIFDGKTDTCSPEELRQESMPRPDVQTQSGVTTCSVKTHMQFPRIGSIISNRAASNWPSWQMVYEWEDILAASLSARIVMLKEWIQQKNSFTDSNEYHLIFLLLASDLERFDLGKNCIPIVMDVWRDDIDLFVRHAVKFDLIFVTSLEAYKLISAHGAKNVAYLPYSFPDHYLLDAVPRKDIDIIQFGRTNPVLDNYVSQLLKKYPHLNYVTTVHHQGKIHFHSSLYGLLEASDTRQKFMTILGRSTISLVSTAGMDGSRDTGGFNPVSPRFYECAAGYCRLVGRFPRNEEFEISGFDQIAERVDSYKQFESTVMNYIGKPFDRLNEYRNILKHHTTSSRAALIENALRQVLRPARNKQCEEEIMQHVRDKIATLTNSIASYTTENRCDPFELNIMHRTVADLIFFYRHFWGMPLESEYSRLIASCTDLPESLACTAVMLRHQKQYDAAATVLKTALDLAPEAIHYRTLRADVLREKGDVVSARLECENVRQTNPDFAEIEFVMAQCDVYEQLGACREYYDLLHMAHKQRKPGVYIEIGVSNGKSLALAGKDTVAIGIDPLTAIPGNLVFASPENDPKLYKMTSDDFFATENVKKIIGKPSFDMAFIDGLHIFEQVLRDFINLEKYAGPDSVIFIHDCLPVNARVAERVRQAAFWIGDVWKIIPCLKDLRPELVITTLPAPPSGLAVIRNLDPGSKVLEKHFDSIVSHYIQSQLPADKNSLFELLNVEDADSGVFDRLLGGYCKGVM